MSKVPNEDDLLTKAIADDRAALAELLLGHYTQLMQHIKTNMGAALRGQEEPEDLLQQTFVEATRSIGRYQIRPGASFLSWLKGIANHRIRDAARKRRPNPVSAIGDINGVNAGSIIGLLDLIEADQSSPSRVAALRELAPALHLMIAQLESPEQREALRLRYLEGLTTAEVAERMDCKEGAIRGLVYRASSKLREALLRASLWMSS